MGWEGGWEGGGAGEALDQHLALGTCGLIQRLELFSKGLRTEAHAASPLMRIGVEEVAPGVALCSALSASSPVLSGNLPGAPRASSHCLGPSCPLYMGWFMSAPQPWEGAYTRAAQQLSGLSVLSWDTIVSLFSSHKEP